MRLEALFRPKSIAVVGASDKPTMGRRLIASLDRIGFVGRIFPINPNYSEPLHLALSSPHDLMGVFSAIVFSEAPIVEAGEVQLPKSRAVGAQLVGDQQLGCEALFLEQLAHQPGCRLGIAPTLNEHVRGPRPHGRRRATGTSAFRRSGRPSRRGAIARSGVGGLAAACVRSAGRILAPSATLLHGSAGLSVLGRVA